MFYPTNQEQAQLLQDLLAEYNRPFSGWDFSYLHGRMIEDDTPISWNYRATVLSYLRTAHVLLDMGTGGGEFLSSLQPLPSETSATEGYIPNIAIARQQLEPLGVTVYVVDEDQHLPFENGHFDLVINRHESYAPREIHRILRSGGHFITQQVGGRNNLDLNALLRGPSDFGMTSWDCAYAVQELEQAGMQIIEQREAYPFTRFSDIGAVVYYLKAIPWQVSDFSVEKYFEPLVRIADQIRKDGWVEIRSHSFFIIARKQ